MDVNFNHPPLTLRPAFDLAPTWFRRLFDSLNFCTFADVEQCTLVRPSSSQRPSAGWCRVIEDITLAHGRTRRMRVPK